MTSELAVGAIVVIPLFVGFAVHGLCIRIGLLRGLAVPIHTRRFGANKTYRGLVAVALGTAAGFVAIRPPELLTPVASSSRLALIGVAAGLAAMLAELPNSFIKRRLEIAPGTQRRSPGGWALTLVDQFDIVLGIYLACLPVWVMPARTLLAGVIVVTAVHLVLNVAGYALGARTAPI